MAAPSRPSLGKTASLLHNNLACSGSGAFFAGVHNSVSTGGGKVTSGRLLLHDVASGASSPGPEGEQIMSIRYLEFTYGSLLCASSTNGTTIYNEDASMLLCYAPADAAAQVPDKLRYHQGACVVPSMQQIAIGTSKGTLVLVSAGHPSQLAVCGEAAPSGATTEVADVCYVQATNQVVSVHNNGDIRFWDVATTPFSNCAAVASMSQAPVRAAALGLRLLVAYGPGTVCLYDVASGELQVEITAHARWLTAVAVREDAGQVATVGEDTVLNVWAVEPTDGQVSLLHSSVVTDKLLTGVAFCSGGVGVTAYDSDVLFHVPL